MNHLMIAALLVGTLSACSKAAPPTVFDAGPDPAAEAHAPEPTPEERLAKTVQSKTTLATVLPLVKPHFNDGLKLDTGKAILLGWVDSHLTWSELEQLPETTFGKVQKDSASERGKRICRSGVVVEIAKMKDFPNAFVGGLLTSTREVLRFYSVGDTGELVGGSSAKFCGIVTGTDDYANSAGGTTHGVAVIGMFDLPPNRKRVAASSTAADGWNAAR